VNPADVLSKHWAHHAVWSQLQAILFWKGDTADLLDKEDQAKAKEGERQSIPSV
jgi:hypothetical protein